jgi:hypothetical protein
VLHRPRSQWASGRVFYYFDEDQGNSAGKLVSRDEAEEIAAKIARLPDLP